MAIEKVTDEAVKVKNAHLRKVMADKGIDADYVALFHDYAPRSKGREYAPNARFYRDRKSGQHIAEFSILPHCDTLGRKIDCRWILSNGKYYSGINLFSAIIDGEQIKVTALSDQPQGAKKNDWVSWTPQIFLNGIEQLHTGPILLTTDPINAGYHDNTIEWDYGICKRRVRIIEGRIREKWPTYFRGIHEIAHNSSGNLPLKFGQCTRADGEPVSVQVIGDREIVDTTDFPDSAFPVVIGASPDTFYPDPSVENTSVDGFVTDDNENVTFQTMVAKPGDGASDSGSYMPVQLTASTTTNQWKNIIRCIVLFDTSGLPAAATVTGAVFSVWCYNKNDDISATPDVNVYKSTPFSNTVLQADDFVDIGTVALSSAIAYGDVDAAGYNNFTLTDVDTDDFGYIPVDGICKLGLRNANYDVADELDPGNHDPNWVNDESGYFEFYSADQGNTTNDPKLVVTYTEAGWTGTVCGVSNPAYVNGVAVANIAAVIGVS